MKVNCYGKSYGVSVTKSAYRDNNSLAVLLTCTDEDCYGEPFAVLTVNLCDGMANEEYAYVDTNNCPWAEEFIKENNLGTPTGLMGYSGYCSYPLYLFSL